MVFGYFTDHLLLNRNSYWYISILSINKSDFRWAA